jgi:large subunit ribosomal protein L24
MARHVKKDDVVKVISGGEKGKTGKVLRVLVDKDKGDNTRVIVEGLNRVWKHVKPSQRYPQGGRIQKEASIHISNVQPIDPATGKPTRVRFRLDGDKKVRVAAKSGTVLSTLRK